MFVVVSSSSEGCTLLLLAYIIRAVATVLCLHADVVMASPLSDSALDDWASVSSLSSHMLNEKDGMQQTFVCVSVAYGGVWCSFFYYK